MQHPASQHRGKGFVSEAAGGTEPELGTAVWDK